MSGNIRVEKTVAINKSPEELYRFWRNFENLPLFMEHLKFVRVKTDTRSHWVAKAPLGASVEWDTEIIKEQENYLIAWSSVKGAKFDNRGAVRFQKAPNERGTEVKVVIEFNPPSSAIAATVAKFVCQDPEQELSHSLHRFKQLMEVGELVSLANQSVA